MTGPAAVANDHGRTQEDYEISLFSEDTGLVKGAVPVIEWIAMNSCCIPRQYLLAAVLLATTDFRKSAQGQELVARWEKNITGDAPGTQNES